MWIVSPEFYPPFGYYVVWLAPGNSCPEHGATGVYLLRGVKQIEDRLLGQTVMI
jgi:hypothetical protein